MSQDWCSYQFGLKLKEGSGTIFCPLESHPFLCQLVEWSCYLREPKNESPIIATKPSKRSHFFHICWHRPVSDTFCFLWVCTNTFFRINMSKKFISLGKQLELPLVSTQLLAASQKHHPNFSAFYQMFSNTLLCHQGILGKFPSEDQLELFQPASQT